MQRARQQLRLFLLLDLGLTAGSAIAVAALSQVLPWSPLYPLVVALPTAEVVVLVHAVRTLRRGEVAAAVRWASIANWVVAIAVAAVVTFLWPPMLLVAVLPGFLAVSFLPTPRVRRYLAISLVVAVAVALLGLLQDFSGFSDAAPRAARNSVLIVVTPLMALMIVVIARAHSERLQAALTAAVRAGDAQARQAQELRASRARVVAAADHARRRIEQDLHDGAQQRLVAIKLRLTQVSDWCAEDPAAARTALEELRDEVGAAHRELRELAQGVYPPVLEEHGLAEALRSAADRSHVPVVLDLHEPIPRAEREVEATLYFCAVEALQNTAKHGGGDVTATVSAAGTDNALWIQIADDGRGFDPAAISGGMGLQNLADRLGVVGGTLEVESARGRGARVLATVPLNARGNGNRPEQQPGTVR